MTAPFLTGITGTGTGQYFTDQNSNPFLVKGDSIWGLAVNAGVNGGSTTYQSDIDLYMSTRASQGFNATILDCSPSSDVTGVPADGATWDGVLPWTGGTVGNMNNAWWNRVDYAVSSAQTNGITIFMACADEYAMPGRVSGGMLGTATSTTMQNYGAALAARYKSAPNLVWLFGNDYYGDNDSLYSSCLTGIRNGGDTHLVSIENLTETTSRWSCNANEAEVWGTSNAQFNSVYTYGGCYPCIEYAYAESSPLPVLLVDGWYDGDGATVLPARDFMRGLVWWSLSSGSRGYIYGRGGFSGTDLWAWNAGASATLTTNTFDNSDLKSIWRTFGSFTGWHQLVPDTSSALVTAGRGTPLPTFASNNGGSYTGFSGGSNLGSGVNTYVTASKTADGTLAVIYLPNAASAITINQAQMVPSYTATWVDPVSGAMTTSVTGSTYSHSGANSVGAADWVLVLQGSLHRPHLPSACDALRQWASRG